MNKYVVVELYNDEVYIVGIKNIEVCSKLKVRRGKGTEIKPVGRVIFSNFNYRIRRSRWRGDDDSNTAKKNSDGSFVEYTDIYLPLDNKGNIKSDAVLEFESDIDAKLYAEVLRSEYAIQEKGDEESA